MTSEYSTFIQFISLVLLCMRSPNSLGFDVAILLNLQYFMKTGTCKFGASCKYHHPRQGGGSVSPVALNYYGYPLRPVTPLYFPWPLHSYYSYKDVHIMNCQLG